MEDGLHFFENGRQPQYFSKWKTTSICLKIEDDFNFWEKEDKLILLFKMEDDLNCSKMEDDLNCSKWKTTSIIFLKLRTTSIFFEQHQTK